MNFEERWTNQIQIIPIHLALGIRMHRQIGSRYVQVPLKRNSRRLRTHWIIKTPWPVFFYRNFKVASFCPLLRTILTLILKIFNIRIIFIVGSPLTDKPNPTFKWYWVPKPISMSVKSMFLILNGWSFVKTSPQISPCRWFWWLQTFHPITFWQLCTHSPFFIPLTSHRDTVHMIAI